VFKPVLSLKLSNELSLTGINQNKSGMNQINSFDITLEQPRDDSKEEKQIS
jgi:hypothetical protein